MPHTIRVGVVGYGLAGRVFHAPMVSAVPGLELAAIVERSTHNAAKTYPDAVIYPSLDAMLSDNTLELIVVGTPNESHVPLALEALKAGRHVVVDKPVAATAEEIAGLMASAREAGRLLIPFHNRRWDSDFQTLRKLLNEQKLGRVVSFESTFDRWRPHPKLESWRDNGRYGAGILLDLGTHLADQVLQLFGLPLGVSAEVLSERDAAISVDSFSVRLRYSGLMASISGNCLASLPRPHYLVRGTAGNFIKWGLDPQEEALKKSPRVVEPWGIEPQSSWGTLALGREDGSADAHAIKPIPGDYRLYYAGVRDAILGSAAPPVAPVDAWRVAQLLEWAQQSAEEHREIACDWSGQPEE